jgi:hypothetical protein
MAHKKLLPILLPMFLNSAAFGQSAPAKPLARPLPSKAPAPSPPPVASRIESQQIGFGVVPLDSGGSLIFKAQPGYRKSSTGDVEHTLYYTVTEPNDHDWTPTTVQVDMGGYCERSEHFYPDRWQDTLNIDNVFWKEGTRYVPTRSQNCVLGFLKATVLTLGSRTITTAPQIDFPKLEDWVDQEEANSERLAERRRIRAGCTAVYQTTIDKKISDLTVRQSEQVNACQLLDLYH